MKIRPRYADVAATLALVISLGGGTAYAATLITSADIEDGTIQSVDVADAGILSRDLKDGSVGHVDVTNGSLSGTDIKDGGIGLVDISEAARTELQGQKGDQGDPGLPGADGADGVSGWEVIRQPYAGAVSDANKQVIMYCPEGKKPLSGGYDMAEGSRVVTVNENHYYNLGGQGWVVGARLTALNGNVTPDYTFAGWLICAAVQ